MNKRKHEDYAAFVEKFKPKLTTDDCYTPDEVYAAVLGWVCRRYQIDPAETVRPFWPGGDYENLDYSGGKVVVDNPPFSILSKICAFYLDRDIPFFLFAPSLTAFSARSVCMRMNHIFTDSEIIYHNGARIRTAFVTSYGGNIAETAPDLAAAIAQAQQNKAAKRQLPKYDYPNEVVTAATLQRFAKYGQTLVIGKDDCTFIARLDDQKESGKSIFGGGLLLSEKKTAERCTIEKNIPSKEIGQRWALSEREKQIVKSLGKG